MSLFTLSAITSYMNHSHNSTTWSSKLLSCYNIYCRTKSGRFTA